MRCRLCFLRASELCDRPPFLFRIKQLVNDIRGAATFGRGKPSTLQPQGLADRLVSGLVGVARVKKAFAAG